MISKTNFEEIATATFSFVLSIIDMVVHRVAGKTICNDEAPNATNTLRHIVCTLLTKVKADINDTAAWLPLLLPTSINTE